MGSTLIQKVFSSAIDAVLIIISLYYSIASIILFIFAMFLPSDVSFNEFPSFLYIVSLIVMTIYGAWIFIDIVFVKSKVMSKYFLMVSTVVCLLSFFNYLSFFELIPDINEVDPIFDPLQIVFLFTTILPLLYMTKYFCFSKS